MRHGHADARSPPRGCATVGACATAARGVDDEVDLAGRDQVDRVRARCPPRPSRRRVATGTRSASRCAAVPAVAAMREPELDEAPGRLEPRGLVAVGERQEHRPLLGSGSPAAIWLFANARPNVRSMPMTSPVERISGPSTVSTSGKRLNGSTASFTATCAPTRSAAAGPPRAARRGWRRPSPGRRPSRAARRSPWPRTAPCGWPAGWPRCTNTWSAFTAYCTLMSPRTSSASAIARV